MSQPERKLNIALGLWNSPTMMGGYYAKALAKQARIWTLGPKVSASDNDFTVLPGQPVGPVLAKIGEPVDFFVCFYSKPDFFPADIHDLPCPTAWYVYDTHLHLDELSTTAYLFDLVLACDGPARQDLMAMGLDNVEVLDYAADVETYYRPHDPKRPRKYQVGFAGSLGGHPALQGRRELLERIGKIFNLRVEDRTLTGKAVSDFYQDCSVVLNQAVNNEYNMRVPEALLSGRPLLTPRVRGIESYVQPGFQAEVYDLDNVEVKLQHLLDHPEEAEAMARRGQEEFLRLHTYDQRATALIGHLRAELARIGTQGRRARNPWLKQAAQFRYHHFRFPGDGIRFLLQQWPANSKGRFANRLLRFLLRVYLQGLRLYDRLRGTEHFQKPH